MISILLVGIILGILIFVFTFTATKRTGRFYLAPIVTFLIAFFIVLYGIVKMSGFEVMGFWFLAAGICIVAIIGTIALLFMKGMKKSNFNKVDKSILVLIPVIIFSFIAFTLSSNHSYWIIDEGMIMSEEETPTYYQVSTISEGKKQIYVQLGEEFVGKVIKINDIKTLGNTEITLDIIEDGKQERLPFIRIGIDEVVEPLVIQTSDGQVIKPKEDNILGKTN
ncbi:hypothetical protein [Halalkalibacter okhensis]|uniref:Uncharacterized protein n=1 Tax=Halalkalibacter okhensis TaxID=333138 RepID=A0A0B0I6M5_9BACI|nr:hypothetical protein [Halalkalibacter okhensis]KHF38128.1 hypothetical protein LQ50_23220 [Halalkalibacter okhensis]